MSFCGLWGPWVSHLIFASLFEEVIIKAATRAHQEGQDMKKSELDGECGNVFPELISRERQKAWTWLSWAGVWQSEIDVSQERDWK